LDFGIKLKCPYCGIEQSHTIEGGRWNSEVVTCSAEDDDMFKDNGCKREFVLRWKLEPIFTVHAIEGENTKKQAAHDGDR